MHLLDLNEQMGVLYFSKNVPSLQCFLPYTKSHFWQVVGSVNLTWDIKIWLDYFSGNYLKRWKFFSQVDIWTFSWHFVELIRRLFACMRSPFSHCMVLFEMYLKDGINTTRQYKSLIDIISSKNILLCEHT